MNPSTSLPTPSPRILYVEDYQDSCELVSMLLAVEKCDYNFSIANTAREALDLIGKQSFDLYILNYRLPEMSGVELCRRIRQTNSVTPILFFTGMARPADRHVAMAAGADEYLVKPDNLDKITTTVKRLLLRSLSSTERFTI